MNWDEIYVNSFPDIKMIEIHSKHKPQGLHTSLTIGLVIQMIQNSINIDKMSKACKS